MTVIMPAPLTLACIGCTIGSDGHKILLFLLGLALLATAYLLHRRRQRAAEAGRGFDVLPADSGE